ncbi:MAG: 50S ribosomal protein L21 [Myxococcota bacterium]|nr:50S ribosomal protein L21 [Myxococcota bacterium]
MYAVIRTGGKQHRVVAGERLKVEKLTGDVGAELQFTDVLLVGADDDVKIGRPLVEGASVSAKIVTQGRGPKIKVFKRKRRQGFHKMIGHRQPFTEVEITSISA